MHTALDGRKPHVALTNAVICARYGGPLRLMRLGIVPEWAADWTAALEDPDGYARRIITSCPVVAEHATPEEIDEAVQHGRMGARGIWRSPSEAAESAQYDLREAIRARLDGVPWPGPRFLSFVTKEGANLY